MAQLTRETAHAPAQEIPLRVEMSRQDQEIQRLLGVVETLAQRLEPVVANIPPNPRISTLGADTPGRGSAGLSPLLNTLNDHRLRLSGAVDTLAGLLERLEV